MLFDKETAFLHELNTNKIDKTNLIFVQFQSIYLLKFRNIKHEQIIVEYKLDIFKCILSLKLNISFFIFPKLKLKSTNFFTENSLIFNLKTEELGLTPQTSKFISNKFNFNFIEN